MATEGGDDGVEAAAGPAPVASFDEVGSADFGSDGSGAAPVAQFGADQFGAEEFGAEEFGVARPAVPVVEFGQATARPEVRVVEFGDAVTRRTGRPPRSVRSTRAGERPAATERPTAAERPTAGQRPDPGQRSRSGPGSGSGPARELDADADPASVARTICLRLLTERARTRHELADALRRKGVPDDAAGAVLERFSDVGLIDDAAFAEQWVRSRHAGRGLGRRALAVELRRKGVDAELAGAALETVDSDAEELRARQLVDRKLRGLALETREERATAVRRLAGMLARKGYGAGVAYRVVREAIAAHGADVEELEGADDTD